VTSSRRRWLRVGRSGRGARRWGSSTGEAGQTLGALGFNSITSFAAGAILVALVPTFREVPGLLILTTPAIGLGGNIFTTLGNRLSTSIHVGTFAPTLRPRSIVGQNLRASLTLVLLLSVALALMTPPLATATGQHTVGLSMLLSIAVLGGLLGAIPTVVVTIALTWGAVRFGWDLDNLVAPIVSTVGDVLTIPALYVATLVVRPAHVSIWLSVVFVIAAIAMCVWSLRSKLAELVRIIRESVPVLVLALILDTLGGLVLQHQLNRLAALPAILVLIPAFVSTGGALGGIFCGRVATKLHLGRIEPHGLPRRGLRTDLIFIAALTVPIFAFNGAGSVVTAIWSSAGAAPGWASTITVSMIAAAATMIAVVAMSYWLTIGAWRLEIDPDSAGVPIMSSATDFVGAVAVITTAAALGLR
jgi:mgtE-like transporter